jgi:hypothetical protein
MNNDSLWKLASEVEAALIAHYQPVFDHFCDTTGMDGPMIGLLLAALSFDPDVTNPARLLVRNPYTAAETFMARLWVAAEKGFMIENSPGEYRSTAIGRARLVDLVQEARESMARVDPLPLVDSERLASLLGLLVQSSLNSPPPPDTWSIRHAYRLMPAPRPPLPYIEQAISCLQGYRDDAHLAAWQKTGLTATALETLTLLWNHEASSLETLCQRLARRGHSPQVYNHALEDLRERGFVEDANHTARITPAGQAFRDGVERETEQYFFAPWGVLSEAHRESLGELLAHLRDKLNDQHE